MIEKIKKWPLTDILIYAAAGLFIIQFLGRIIAYAPRINEYGFEFAFIIHPKLLLLLGSH